MMDQKITFTLERKVLYILNNLLINREMSEENESTISKISKPVKFDRTSSPIQVVE